MWYTILDITECVGVKLEKGIKESATKRRGKGKKKAAGERESGAQNGGARESRGWKKKKESKKNPKEASPAVLEFNQANTEEHFRAFFWSINLADGTGGNQEG